MTGHNIAHAVPDSIRYKAVQQSRMNWKSEGIKWQFGSAIQLSSSREAFTLEITLSVH